MWLYFNKNQNKYEFELSPKDCEMWGIKKSSYYRGIEELEKFGYLKPIKEGSNIYRFYEYPVEWYMSFISIFFENLWYQFE